MIQNIKWHHDYMKTEGGVVIVKPNSVKKQSKLLEVNIWIEKDQNAIFTISIFFEQ